jgi:putative ABC transport system substrate-binding protein
VKQFRLWLLPVILFALIHSAAAQQRTKIPRVGYLVPASPSAIADRSAAFRKGLRDLGYEEGKNIIVEYRYAEGSQERLRELAAELVHANVDVIVTTSSAPTRAAKEATSTIPIVMAQDNDPVGNGFVVSLAHPAGNITGLAALDPELSGKRLELLKELVPGLSRLAIIGDSRFPGYEKVVKETERAAGSYKITLHYLDVLQPSDIESAFATAKKHSDGLLTMTSPELFSNRTRVAALAIRHHMPAIYHQSQYVEAGGLMSYGASFIDMDRRAAIYVDKILKGANPAEMPVEQPKKFEFVVNLKAANQIGLVIPPRALTRADRVIK